MNETLKPDRNQENIPVSDDLNEMVSKTEGEIVDIFDYKILSYIVSSFVVVSEFFKSVLEVSEASVDLMEFVDRSSDISKLKMSDRTDFDETQLQKTMTSKLKQTLFMLKQLNKQLEIDNENKGKLMNNIKNLVDQKPQIASMSHKDLYKYDNEILHSLYENTLKYWREKIIFDKNRLNNKNQKTLKLYYDILNRINLYESDYQADLIDKTNYLLHSES